MDKRSKEIIQNSLWKLHSEINDRAKKYRKSGIHDMANDLEYYMEEINIARLQVEEIE